MNKITETILILTAIFGAGLIPVSFAFVQTDNLVVEFETTPLYNEANFLPGEEVSRWVKVTNNGGQTQRIAAEVINKNDPDNFASRMNLTIAEGAAVIFNKTLAEFFNQGETYLSSLASGAQTQYDLKITFNSGSGNNYQEKNLGFDILVGFQGTEGGLPLPLPGDGSSGGGDGRCDKETISAVGRIRSRAVAGLGGRRRLLSRQGLEKSIGFVVAGLL